MLFFSYYYHHHLFKCVLLSIPHLFLPLLFFPPCKSYAPLTRFFLFYPLSTPHYNLSLSLSKSVGYVGQPTVAYVNPRPPPPPPSLSLSLSRCPPPAIFLIRGGEETNFFSSRCWKLMIQTWLKLPVQVIANSDNYSKSMLRCGDFEQKKLSVK